MEKTLIDYRLYDPTKSLFGNKSDKAKFTTLHCSNAQCPVLAQGKCAVWHGLGTHCPYGERRAETGWTPRARKFRSWINDKKKQVEGMKQLGSWDKIAQIGDYIFFPYPHWSIDMQAVDQKYRHGFFNSPNLFIPVDVFTIDLFEKIINAQPRAMLGGVITSYRTETVPKIIMHTQEELPEFYAQWADKYPQTAGRFKTVDYVGRKAYLKTVRPSSVFPSDKGEMVWDGKQLVIESYKSVFIPVKGKAKLIIYPDDNTVVTITDNNQVTEETRFET